MSKKVQLPDEFLNAVSGGIMVVEGKDVTDYGVSEKDGMTTFTLMTDSGKYSLELETDSFKQKLIQTYSRKADADTKNRYSMDSFGFKPMGE